MAEPTPRAGRRLTLALLLGLSACASPTDQLEQHRQQLASLNATARRASESWLDGRVSAAYTRATLETAYRLLERERASIAARPRNLTDPSFVMFLADTERDMREVALALEDVKAERAASLRGRLAQGPARGHEP